MQRLRNRSCDRSNVRNGKCVSESRNRGEFSKSTSLSGHDGCLLQRSIAFREQISPRSRTFRHIVTSRGEITRGKKSKKNASR